jgi:hypothetical protein
MSNITTINKTDITPSGFGMPIYGCAFTPAVKGAVAAARVRQMGGALLSATGTVPGPRAWSPPNS